MSDYSLNIVIETEGILAEVTVDFSFSGDWSNAYGDVFDSEDESRLQFVRSVDESIKHMAGHSE